MENLSPNSSLNSKYGRNLNSICVPTWRSERWWNSNSKKSKLIQALILSSNKTIVDGDYKVFYSWITLDAFLMIFSLVSLIHASIFMNFHWRSSLRHGWCWLNYESASISKSTFRPVMESTLLAEFWFLIELAWAKLRLSRGLNPCCQENLILKTFITIKIFWMINFKLNA